MNSKSLNLIKHNSNDGANHIIHSNLLEYNRRNISTKYSLKTVTQGIERYLIDGVEHLVKPNQFLIVNPGQEVAVTIDSSINVEGHCFFFDTKMIKQIAYSNQKKLSKNLDNIDQVIDVDLFLSDFLISVAESLVDHKENIQSQFFKIEGSKSETKKELYLRIESGRDFIHQNYSNPISLKDMAKAAKLSEYYFHRNFRIYFNQTPHSYLKSIRIEKAKILLSQSKYSKSEIANMCGFQDTKYFSKVMKKIIS